MYQKKTINIIKTDNGSEITDAKDIICELENFYFNLYKSTTDKEERTIDDELVQDDDISSVFTNEQRESCARLLNEQERLASLKCFKMNKSPGCDGIPAEFCLECWHDIGPKKSLQRLLRLDEKNIFHISYIPTNLALSVDPLENRYDL